MIDKRYFSLYNYFHEVKKKKMEQVESIPFSALIAGIMLYKKEYSSIEIVGILGKLEGEMGVVIDDENDNLDELSCCVEISSSYDFQLKKGVDYSTVLNQDITVLKFFMIHTNQFILSFLDEYFHHSILNQESRCNLSRKTSLDKEEIYKPNRKVLIKEKIRDDDGFFRRRINLIGELF